MTAALASAPAGDDGLQLRPGGLWYRIAVQLQLGPVHYARLYIRLRDIDRSKPSREKARARFHRALELMTRAGLLRRAGDHGYALTETGRAELDRACDAQLARAWAHIATPDLERAVAEAATPAERQARARALRLRLEGSLPA